MTSKAAASCQHIADLQRLFAGVRLGYQQLVHLDAQIPRVDRIQGVLRIDKCRFAALLLRFRDDMQSQGRLTGGFRPVDLYDPALRHAAHAGGQVQAYGACGDRIDIHLRRRVPQLHDGALAKLFLDLRHGVSQRFLPCFYIIDSAAAYLTVRIVAHSLPPHEHLFSFNNTLSAASGQAFSCQWSNV